MQMPTCDCCLINFEIKVLVELSLTLIVQSQICVKDKRTPGVLTKKKMQKSETR